MTDENSRPIIRAKIGLDKGAKNKAKSYANGAFLRCKSSLEAHRRDLKGLLDGNSNGDSHTLR